MNGVGHRGCRRSISKVPNVVLGIGHWRCHDREGSAFFCRREVHGEQRLGVHPYRHCDGVMAAAGMQGHEFNAFCHLIASGVGEFVFWSDVRADGIVREGPLVAVRTYTFVDKHRRKRGAFRTRYRAQSFCTFSPRHLHGLDCGTVRLVDGQGCHLICLCHRGVAKKNMGHRVSLGAMVIAKRPCHRPVRGCHKIHKQWGATHADVA